VWTLLPSTSKERGLAPVPASQRATRFRLDWPAMPLYRAPRARLDVNPLRGRLSTFSPLKLDKEVRRLEALSRKVSREGPPRESSSASSSTASASPRPRERRPSTRAASQIGKVHEAATILSPTRGTSVSWAFRGRRPPRPPCLHALSRSEILGEAVYAPRAARSSLSTCEHPEEKVVGLNHEFGGPRSSRLSALLLAALPRPHPGGQEARPRVIDCQDVEPGLKTSGAERWSPSAAGAR